ncbi:beta-galactosidase [Catellatospora methionotrophica]|uniref:Beta-galactosidase n=1 Tax=Catellatospora methionotrophica TaxID=121620 RepID=A0A8J3PGZ5_9ACTN|nr:beta-galactosidase [Catellatospora methionotrophica]GIG15858.1 beta-galactosidase [Catellatospora methionotrophica]
MPTNSTFYGADWNPEQWPEPVWAQDLALMREARVTAATVGVFSWSRLEPSPGAYDFGWLDRVLDGLHAHGIGAVLATPTASPPPWFTRAHPDALATRRDGVRLVHGSRDTYCVNAPAYRAASLRIATALAVRYARHPALRLWHVHNEYGTWCFCDHCARAFRTWLRERHGAVDALNDAWTADFWSQRHGDWSEILPPRATQYLGNPAHELDYRRFLSDSMLAAYTEQRDAIKAVAPAAQVTTNFVLGGWVPVDHASWSREVDLVAIDHYPSTLDGVPAQSAFAADAARGWSAAAGHGGRWLLMEHAPGHVTEQGVQRRKPPGMLARTALAHVARGSAGAMYFQWRASRGGAEQWHTALVAHPGPATRLFAEAVALGNRLAATEGRAPSDRSADRKVPFPTGEPAGAATACGEVAVWFDETCGWAVGASHLPAPVDYQGIVEDWHRALWRLGYQVDVVPPSAALDGYRVLVVPAAYLLTDESARRLERYVREGGHLVVTYLSGIVDEHLRVRLGGYPGALRELLGVHVEEFDPLPTGTAVTLDNGDRATAWTEHLTAPGAAVQVSYPDGRPAITRREHGTGTAHYVSCGLAETATAHLLDGVCAAAGAAPVLPGLPDGVEAVRATDGVWLFNHTGESHDIAGHALQPGAAMELPAFSSLFTEIAATRSR